MANPYPIVDTVSDAFSTPPSDVAINLADAASTSPDMEAKRYDVALQTDTPPALLQGESSDYLNRLETGAIDYADVEANDPALAKLFKDEHAAKIARDEFNELQQASFLSKTLQPIRDAGRLIAGAAAGVESGAGNAVTVHSVKALEKMVGEFTDIQAVKNGTMSFDDFRLKHTTDESLAGVKHTADPRVDVATWEADLSARFAETGKRLNYVAQRKPFLSTPEEIQKFTQSKGLEQTLNNITPEVVGYFTGEGLAQSPVALAAGAASAPLRGAVALAARVGIQADSTYDLNYYLDTAGKLRASGIDLTNPQAVYDYYNTDAAKLERKGASTKGVVDAAVNAAASTAAAFTRTPTALFLGAASGPAGEGFGNIAAQQTGAKGYENTAPNLVAEALGDSVFTALEAYNAAARNAGQNTIDAKAYNAIVSRVQQLGDKVSASMDFGAAIDEFTSAFSALKTLQRDPTVAHKFAEDLTDQGAPKDLFIDPQALQQANIDLTEISQLSPSFAARIDEAVATGGTVQMPFSEYVTMVAPKLGDKLNDHVRAEPDGFSRAEAEEFMQTQSELVKTEAANIAAAAKLSEPFEASSAAVEENIFNQLKTAGRFTDNVNRFYARLTASAFTVNGARVGRTAEQFFDEFGGLNIVADTDSSPNVFTQKTYKGMPLNADGKIRISHFSATPGITKLDPEQWGNTGAALPRSERNRQGIAPNRTYAYLGDNFKKENQLGDVLYTGVVDPERYYDLENDPMQLREKGVALSTERGLMNPTAGLEIAIKEAGFDGYIAQAPQGGYALTSYVPLDVTEGDSNDTGQTGAEELQDGSGVRGSRELLDAARRANLEPLENAPGPINVAGVGEVQFGPFAPARIAAEAYMTATGRVYQPPRKHVKIDTKRAKRIAEEFERMEHNPSDPVVEEAYRALIDETLAQYQYVKQTGLKIEFIQLGQDDPYAASPRLATLDVVNNNHLWVFPTDFGFGGPASAGVDITDNPLLQPTQEYVDGKQLLANDVFRIVHDYFGHIKDGQGFRAEGEENAWQSHAAMFSPLARRALTTETRGQNSWVNFGPYAEKNKTAYCPTGYRARASKAASIAARRARCTTNSRRTHKAKSRTLLAVCSIRTCIALFHRSSTRQARLNSTANRLRRSLKAGLLSRQSTTGRGCLSGLTSQSASLLTAPSRRCMALLTKPGSSKGARRSSRSRTR
jgi:hypothetical protein